MMKIWKTAGLATILIVVLVIRVTLANDSSVVWVHILSKYHPKLIEIKKVADGRSYEVEAKNGGLYVNGYVQNRFGTRNSYLQPWFIKVGNAVRRYKGAILVSVDNGELMVINRLTVKEYLIGVLAGEFASAPLEALKAQAVLARTLIYRKILNRKPDQLFDIGDLTNNQVYAGYYPTKKFAWAIEATQHQVVTYNGELIEPFWHSTCGKRFFTPRQVWNGPDLEYLVYTETDEEYQCKDSPHYQWSRSISRKKLSTIFDIPAIEQRYPKKSKAGIYLGHSSPVLTLEGFRLKVNRIEGWNFIKSNDYKITRTMGEIHFKGNGLGHNIGLCQCQASEMARDNVLYTRILQRYFPKTKIRTFQID